MNKNSKITTPEILEISLIVVPDVVDKIQQVSDALVDVLEEIGCPDGISKVRSIELTQVIHKEILQRLITIYREIHRIYRRLSELLAEGEFDEMNKEVIRNRAEQIVNDDLYLHQREIFFKIVNAKEVADGEKNEDGPALLFPGIEKVKNSIIRNIQRQTSELHPEAVDICKAFRGIADKYVAAEPLRSGKKSKYDTINQAFEQEKRVKHEVIKRISFTKLDDTRYLESLISSFELLKEVYRKKSRSLRDINSLSVSNYGLKLAILEKGCDKVDLRLKPLRVLKNMAEQFPILEKQLDFFADSHYQARAVLNVLEEVKEEMKQVFSQYNLESFTVVSFLKYKLNGISHMYESIHYYYAVIQMEKDMEAAFAKRYFRPEEGNVNDAVNQKLETVGIAEIIRSIHQYITSMNSENHDIHQAFLHYKSKPDIKLLKANLKENTLRINSHHIEVKRAYKAAQKIFAGFLIADLGSTDIESQFNTFLKANKALPEAESLTKSFNNLLATKRKTLADFEKEFAERFNGSVTVDQISAMALLKVKKDFLKELLHEVQEYSYVQEIFLEVLKEFINLRDDKEKQRESDKSVSWLVEHMAGGAFDTFKREKARKTRKVLKKSDLTERDMTVAFLAANITPQEIESFSRLLPALPRNELQLDSPYGRLLLDIKSLYQEQLQLMSASPAHLVERVYEKRERLKLICNIGSLLRTNAERFFLKIEKEEKKINHLMTLQRLKYRKELGEIIRYWQFLIQKQIEPGQGQRGRFRRYSEAEKQMMMKYISPEQLHQIDRQLESSFDLESEDKLQEVESFLLEIISGLFLMFSGDQKMMSRFETFEKGKKIRHRNLQDNDHTDLLSSEHFVSNIKDRLSRKKKKDATEITAVVVA